MKPLYPARFRSADVIAQHWAELPENLQFYRHLRNVCHGFPSTVLAYAARPGLAELAAGIAEGLMTCGINVFMPSQAVPICALSQALAARNLPIGLYLDGSFITKAVCYEFIYSCSHLLLPLACFICS